MADEETPIGYQLPLYRSLTEQLLIAGAPASIIVWNAALLGIFVMSLFSFWIIPFNLVIHFGAIYVTRQDNQFFDCLLKYMKKKDYYCT